MDRATRAEIHLNNLKHNIRQIRSRIGDKSKICAAVKADAYGHGAIEVCRAAVSEGVSCFGVATAFEGIEIREAGIKQSVLMYSLPFPYELESIVKYNISVFIADKSGIDLLDREASRQKKMAEVHLKVDTGMGRIGCRPEDALMLACYISGKKNLSLSGVCTHFPVSDIKSDDFTYKQLIVFNSSIDKMREEGINPGEIHAANSGAIIAYPESYFTTVRPGIMLYGYYPSSDQKRILDLKPVMEFKTKVSFIKTVEKGTPISYGMTYRTKARTRIATLCAGYADGYSRLLSNKGKVKIGGSLYPVAGRVCMDQTMVDVGLDSEISVGDDAVLFGPDTQTAEDIADIMNTIPYEVTCLVTKRVPRVFIK
jgi:alanine racemase